MLRLGLTLITELVLSMVQRSSVQMEMAGTGYRQRAINSLVRCICPMKIPVRLKMMRM